MSKTAEIYDTVTKLINAKSGITGPEICAVFRSAGDKALARQSLLKLTRDGTVVREPYRSDTARGASTFKYFPISRQNLASVDFTKPASEPSELRLPVDIWAMSLLEARQLYSELKTLFG